MTGVRQLSWGPWEGPHTLPRWAAASKLAYARANATKVTGPSKVLS
jgi:hypothetical protein